MSKIIGKAKKFDGTAIDYVSIFNWVDGKCIAQVVPNTLGVWEYEYFTDLNVGLTYIADGCEPITHGSYSFDQGSGIPGDAILHYSFNGNYLDSSATYNHGIKTGVGNFVVGRKAGSQALQLKEGETSVVSTNNMVVAGDKITISFWLFRNAADSAGVFILNESKASNSNYFEVGQNIWAAGIGLDAKTWKGSSYDRNITQSVFDNSDGLWHHFVIEVDRGKPASTEGAIYIDNSLSAISKSSADDSTGYFSSNKLMVGGGARYGVKFKGIIQDLRIYNRLLSAEERELLFNE